MAPELPRAPTQRGIRGQPRRRCRCRAEAFVPGRQRRAEGGGQIGAGIRVGHGKDVYPVEGRLTPDHRVRARPQAIGEAVTAE